MSSKSDKKDWPCQWCLRWTCNIKGGYEVACPAEREEPLPDNINEYLVKGYNVANDKSWIICFACGKTSYNTNDVENLWCGYCHKFHN